MNIDLSNIDVREKYTLRNRDIVERSKNCGCLYCGAIFRPMEIKEWQDKRQTAQCPFCEGDHVIGDASGIPVTPFKFLWSRFEEVNPKHFWEWDSLAFKTIMRNLFNKNKKLECIIIEVS